MSTTSKSGKGTVLKILPFTFLCTIGPSVTAATALTIVRYLMCRYDSNRHGQPDPRVGDPVCMDRSVGALTASAITALAVIDGIVSFFSTSYVQRIADTKGRRPLYCTLPFLAMVATASVMVAFVSKSTTVAWILLAVNSITISASTKTMFIPALTITDVANEHQRTRYFSMLESVCLLGPGIGYVVSALASRYSKITLLPYYIALGAQLSAGLYAIFFVPETIHDNDDDDKTDSDASEDEEEREGGFRDALEHTMETIIAPVKPLGLLVPHRDKETGRLEWRLFLVTISLLATTSGVVFIPTASLLYLSDKFKFKAEQNGWVLAYLTFSRFIYILLIFPVIQKGGRKLYHRYHVHKVGLPKTERSRLLQRASYRKREQKSEANHFDIILCFMSCCFDAAALIMVSFSRTPKQALISYGFLALGAGDNPTYKSVFTSLVPPDQDSQALAALDMVWNAARLISPLLLGSVYALFVEIGKPERLFLVAGGSCTVGACLMFPLVLLGKKKVK